MTPRWLNFALRRAEHPTLLPTLAADCVHLVGPGTLRSDHGRLLYENAAGRQATFAPASLRELVAHGPVSVTAEALSLLAEHEIAFTLLRRDGQRAVARLERDRSPRVLERVLQATVLSQPAWQQQLAAELIVEKINSQRAACRHYQRQGKEDTAQLLERLHALAAECTPDKSLDQLRGYEGAASALWFSRFAQLLLAPWRFSSRQYRPPPDPVNALLSLGYSLLYHRTVARVQAAGLEPALGALHDFRSGRLSLGCDLMEPLRVPTVDRWVLLLCNQRRIPYDSFESAKYGGVRLAGEAFDRVLAEWHDHWHAGEFDAILDQLVRRHRQRLSELGGRLPALRAQVEEQGLQADA